MFKISLEFPYDQAPLKWYYGLSYYEITRDLKVFHVIPLNFLIRFWRLIQHLWFETIRTPGYVDQMILAEREKAQRKWRKHYHNAFKLWLADASVALGHNAEKVLRQNEGFDAALDAFDRPLKEVQNG